MLTYKFKIENSKDYDIVDVEKYKNEFYISDDYSYINGVVPQSYGLVNGQKVLVSSPYFPSYESAEISITNFKRMGKISYKRKYGLGNMSVYRFDGNETSVKYINYHGMLIIQDFDGYDNDTNGVTLKDSITIFDKTFPINGDTVEIEETAYIDDKKVVIDDYEYVDEKDFDLLYPEDLNKELFKPKTDITISSIEIYQPENYKNLARFSIGAKSFNTMEVKDLYALKKQDDGYTRVNDGTYICVTFSELDNKGLSVGDIIQYSTKTKEYTHVKAFKEGNLYKVYYNNTTYLSNKGLNFYAEIKDRLHKITLTNEKVDGFFKCYIYNNNSRLTIFLSEDKKSGHTYVQVPGKGELEKKDVTIKDIDTFIINNKQYLYFEGNDGITVYDYVGGRIKVGSVVGSSTIYGDVLDSTDGKFEENFQHTIGKYLLERYESLEYKKISRSFGLGSYNNFSLSKNDVDNPITNEMPYKAITIMKPIDFYVINIPLGNSASTNISQEEIVKRDFYNVEKEKAINRIIDMERDMYTPVVVKDNYKNCDYPQELDDIVTNIKFNLHFRTRYKDTWKVIEDDKNPYTENICNWFITDYPYYLGCDEYKNKVKGEMEKQEEKDRLDFYQNNKIDPFTTSDLLGNLNFNDNDVFYQKGKLSKSFLRLTFFDSPNPQTQSLLYMSTIFVNEKELFTKYINNINLKDEKNFTITTKFAIDKDKEGNIIQLDYPKCVGSDSNSTSVNSEYINLKEKDKNKAKEDFINRRLSCEFNVTNRYATKNNADGFYIYIFREYSEPFYPRSIYMKVEFNHAKYGKTIPFMLPRKYKVNGKNIDYNNNDSLNTNRATIGDENYDIIENMPNKVYDCKDSPNEYFIESELSKDINDFKKGYALKDIYYQQYIELKLIYDEKNRRYCYYSPIKDMYDGKELVFNLWEIKIKPEEQNGNN